MTEGAKTPLLSARELQAYGYRIVIFPNTALRVAMHAVQDALAVLKSEESSAALLPHMATWEERQRVVRLSEYEKLDRQFAHPKPTRIAQ
jgi:methylisocitrate lyase